MTMKRHLWLIILFGFILFALLMCSCTTQRRCLTKFPPQIVIERSDSIVMRDTIIYHDRTVYDTIHADTVFKEKILPGRPNPEIAQMLSDTVKAENTYSEAKAWIENWILYLQLQTKQQVIQRILENAEKETTHWREEYYREFEKQVQPIYKTKKIHKIALWFSGAVILLLIFWIINKFKRFLPI